MIVPFLLAADFMNFTYATNPCATNVPVPVVMRRGNFSYFDPKMGAGFDLHVAAVTKGSLQAGTRQAVVLLACDFPVGGTSAAYLFDERESGAVLLARVATADWGPDWGQGPNSIHVRFAKHLLHVSQCADNDCKATTATTYSLHGGRLTKVVAPSKSR
jgi:hypothetical protein